MGTLVAFCKKLHIGRILAVFAAGFVLLLNVACSSGNDVGARPNNPPVQMGGQNNPHKTGGDGYSEYQMSTDPTVNKRDRAETLKSTQLVATAKKSDMGMTSKRSGERSSLEEARQIPEPRQEVIDRSDPDVKILEKTGKTFKEAAKHLTGEADQSLEQSGKVQQDLSH